MATNLELLHSLMWVKELHIHEVAEFEFGTLERLEQLVQLDGRWKQLQLLGTVVQWFFYVCGLWAVWRTVTGCCRKRGHSDFAKTGRDVSTQSPVTYTSVRHDLDWTGQARFMPLRQDEHGAWTG